MKFQETTGFSAAASARYSFAPHPTFNGPSLEAAKQEFAELEGIRDWKIHAAVIEIEPVEPRTEPEMLPREATPVCP
jgi:hypothetical protein